MSKNWSHSCTCKGQRAVGVPGTLPIVRSAQTPYRYKTHQTTREAKVPFLFRVSKVISASVEIIRPSVIVAAPLLRLAVQLLKCTRAPDSSSAFPSTSNAPLWPHERMESNSTVPRVSKLPSTWTAPMDCLELTFWKDKTAVGFRTRRALARNAPADPSV